MNDSASFVFGSEQLIDGLFVVYAVLVVACRLLLEKPGFFAILFANALCPIVSG